jgi:4'-phosphopantetheinyl transferase
MSLAGGTNQIWRELTELLSRTEIDRAAKFYFEQQRNEYIAAHALTRRMLSEVGGGAPKDWVFSIGHWGKPIIEGRNDLHFSLSHTDGLVACAISREVVLGIDAEPTNRECFFDVALRFFAPEEQIWLMSLPKASRSRGFLRLWTLKEAFVKATGMGLSYGLENFVVLFDPLRVSLGNEGQATQWRLYERIVGESHALALAWSGPDAEIVTLEKSLQDIV